MWTLSLWWEVKQTPERDTDWVRDVVRQVIEYLSRTATSPLPPEMHHCNTSQAWPKAASCARYGEHFFPQFLELAQLRLVSES